MKQTIQIILLVVLVIAGAGAYLYQQQGSFDAILSMFGGDSSPPPAPVKVAPPPTRPAKPKDTGPLIPAQPASGQINNVAIAVLKSEIEGNVLTLHEGVQSTGTEIKVFLNTKPWEVPTGKTFRFIDTPTAPDVPRIRVRSGDDGPGALRQREFSDKYTLVLELGQEHDRRVPGKIYLSLPDDTKSQIAGTFEAEIRGFRIIDGKPDLSGDSIDTLQYLALRDTLKDDPDKPIEDAAFHHGRYDATGTPPTGYIEFDHRAGPDQLTTRKYQFVKENNEWRVERVLSPHQIAQAHPHSPPGPKSAPGNLLPYLAAKKLEADARKRHAGQTLTGVEFTVSTNPAHSFGVAGVSYQTGRNQPAKTSYLFKKGAKGWALVRELGKKEKLNIKTGRVEKQR